MQQLTLGQKFDLESLPLFSGTPMREPEPKTAKRPVAYQQGSFLEKEAQRQCQATITKRSSRNGLA